jgi:hypothetical protein
LVIALKKAVHPLPVVSTRMAMRGISTRNENQIIAMPSVIAAGRVKGWVPDADVEDTEVEKNLRLRGPRGLRAFGAAGASCSAEVVPVWSVVDSEESGP